MPPTLPFQFRGTATDLTAGLQQQGEEEIAKAKCLGEGGRWDEKNKVCIFPEDELGLPRFPRKDFFTQSFPEEDKGPSKAPGTLEGFTDVETGRTTGLTLPDGRTFLGLSRDEVAQISGAFQKRGLPEGLPRVGTAQEQVNRGFEAEQLRGQVGQFGQLPVSPTRLDFGEATTVGIINSIPRALSFAATGALAGGVVGGTAGAAAAPITGGLSIPAGAALGAVGGFIDGLTSSMISNLKSQRSDTTTAQQRVLDEGKQTMKDWATLAEADPANKAFYLAQYNKVASQIDQSYRQMKLDTNRDVCKFESAIPNLAEFEAFYAPGGDIDTLDQEMRNALLSPVSPEYKMLELAQRRGQIGI